MKENEPWYIAVVEDDDGLRSAILRMLNACGWKPVGFPSAEDFLSFVDLNQTDCMVLDLYLPGMSGFELFDQLKLKELVIPTIFITAQDDEKIRIRAQNIDTLYLPKPFTGQSLAMKVRECMMAQ